MTATAKRQRTSIGLLAACLLALPVCALAQQNPLTGQMMSGRDEAPVAAPAPAAALAPVESSPASTTPLRETAAPSAAPDAVADTTFAPAFRAAQVGDTTRHLLQLQADDSRPGARLPMLGDEASASYDRYLKSFTHPIPEFYEPSVGNNSGGANGGR